MKLTILCFNLLVATLLAGTVLAKEPAPALAPEAAALYQQAKDSGRFSREVERLKPEVRGTADGRSFFLIWKPGKEPKKWIVSLHGAGKPAKGFATDDLAVWAPHLKSREVGLICLQWWLGTGDLIRDFFTPEQCYREISTLLQAMKVEPGQVMLHGFSRGSTNTYAVAALDAGMGAHYFSLSVASSGGVAEDYPPTRKLLEGAYGARPLQGTRWITCAGARDPDPDRDGIPGMRRTAEWLKAQGAEVLESIEDARFDHGALHLNPRNCARVLDVFLKPEKAKAAPPAAGAGR